MAAYEYRSLKKGEIRIFILSPFIGPHRIECTLEHVLLSDQPDFETLSYYWGRNSNYQSVHCEGGTLDVTESLYRILIYLAHRRREKRRLWIDAVCIDQENNEEKGTQIQLMGKIYAQSRQTVVWLEANRSREEAIDRLKKAAL